MGIVLISSFIICCCYICNKYRSQKHRRAMPTQLPCSTVGGRYTTLWTATLSHVTLHPPPSYQHAATSNTHTDNPPTYQQATSIPSYITVARQTSPHTSIDLPVHDQAQVEASGPTGTLYLPADIDPPPYEENDPFVNCRPQQEVPPPENECRHLQATETNVELTGETTIQQEDTSERHGPEISGGHGPEISGGHGPEISGGHGPEIHGGHGPEISGGHGPEISGGHGPEISGGHGPEISGGHGPEISGGHGPEISGGHGPEISGEHGPEIRGGHGPEISGGHGPEISGGHGPEISGGHGPEISGGHGPEISGGHGPEISGGHGPEISGGHGPEISGEHGPEIIGGQTCDSTRLQYFESVSLHLESAEPEKQFETQQETFYMYHDGEI